MFEVHAANLLRYLTGRVGPHHAEDLAAETFLAAFRRWETFDPDRGSPGAWLFGIATNMLRAHYRKEQRHMRAVLASFEQVPEPSASDDVDDRIDAASRVRSMRPALLALDPTDRDILLLVSWAGLTPSEVALALDLPAGSIRSRLSRIRKRLAGQHRDLEAAETSLTHHITNPGSLQ